MGRSLSSDDHAEACDALEAGADASRSCGVDISSAVALPVCLPSPASCCEPTGSAWVPATAANLRLRAFASDRAAHA